MPWVGGLLALFPPTRPAVDNQKQRLSRTYSDVGQPVVELITDDVLLCVEGHELPAGIGWFATIQRGREPV